MNTSTTFSAPHPHEWRAARQHPSFTVNETIDIEQHRPSEVYYASRLF